MSTAHTRQSGLGRYGVGLAGSLHIVESSLWLVVYALKLPHCKVGVRLKRRPTCRRWLQVKRDQLLLRRTRVSLPHVLQRLQAVPWGEPGCGACCVGCGGEEQEEQPRTPRPLLVEVSLDACYVFADADRLLQVLPRLR